LPFVHLSCAFSCQHISMYLSIRKFIKPQLKVSNCRAKTSPKKQRTNLFFYPNFSEILET
jgi:hypothetical protein